MPHPNSSLPDSTTLNGEATAPLDFRPGPAPARQRSRSAYRFWLIALTLVGCAGLAVRTWPRTHRNAAPSAIPIVPVAEAKAGALAESVTFTAELRPYQVVDVHAKVAGYVKHIDVDIGDRVKAGQVLAELEVPELRDDLRQASAATEEARQLVLRAEASFENAHLVSGRLARILHEHPGLIAQQDLSDAQEKDKAAEAGLSASKRKVEEAEAAESKMMAMLDYTKIVAPFDGVVTKRFADAGALVQAGTTSNSQSLPVVTLAQESLLRLQFPVQESVVARVQMGQPVEVRVEALHESFRGKVDRFSRSVDPSTRTMITEVDVPNPDYRFTPGMYASARLQVRESTGGIIIPNEALSGPDGHVVMVINNEQKLEQHTVETGLQTASQVEILSGLELGSRVLIAKGGQFKPGDLVEGRVIAN